jgi:tRNA(Ile)-lysidine synthase
LTHHSPLTTPHLAARLLEYVKTHDLFHKGDKLILAISGGVDSVVLADLLHSSYYSFSLAHCNFNLRPDEVEQERQLVERLAQRYKCPLHIRELDTTAYALEQKISIQLAARELRYSWFNQLLKETNSRYLLTAHHADDNIETLLMNFFKGTGIRGLRGILPKQGAIVRPLLFASKYDIEQYAKEHRLEYAVDSSNSSDKYSRNYFRHNLIPVVRNKFPSAEENLLNNIERFRDIEVLFKETINAYKKLLMEDRGGELQIPVLKLKKLPAFKTILFEIAYDFGYTSSQLNLLVKLLDGETGKYVDSPTHRILKNRNWIIISKKIDDDIRHIVVEEGDVEVAFADGEIHIKRLPADRYRIEPDPKIAAVDGSLIKFPLILRKWKQGDYFYPLGLAKKKKLSRFFIDQKLSKNDKERVWVVEMDKKIVWVVGIRIDDRFKIKTATREVLRLRLVEALG